MSPTRLTKVDPSAAPSIHRLTNAIIALVWTRDEDKLDTIGKDGEVKQEPAGQGGDGGVKKEEADEDKEDGEDEPRYRERIAWGEVAGFISMWVLLMPVAIAHAHARVCKYSASIDTTKRKYTILSPSPGKLPSKVAIAGSVEWLEDDE